jgi:hypothetical protein
MVSKIVSERHAKLGAFNPLLQRHEQVFLPTGTGLSQKLAKLTHSGRHNTGSRLVYGAEA